MNMGAVDDGYPTRPELTDTFGVYLAKGWSSRRPRSSPAPAASSAGDLDPLRMTFSATEPVYRSALQARPGHADRTLYLVSATGSRLRIWPA